MSIRFGYACINLHLSETKKLTPGGTCRKATWQAKGLPHVGEIFERNINAMYEILQWNANNGFNVYRMTSNMAPWSSEYNLSDLPNAERCFALLKKCGDFAKQTNQRLSFHPGQFVVLASKNEKVIKNSIKELETHGEIMDLLGVPRNHYGKINIHVGGAYGDKKATADRFLQNFAKLSDAVKPRLTVENDDRVSLYSTKELHEMIYEKSGIPIVFDYHHHVCHPDGLTEQQALELGLSTWGNVRPTTHYSESAQVEGRKAPFRAHSEYVYSFINDYDNNFDCVIEAKAKEQAVIKYLREHCNA